MAEPADWQGRIQETGANEGFVYVHGYATSFEDAALRAGQVAHDLDYDGLPFLYSWPSQGTTLGYMTDGEVIKLSHEPFIKFLFLAKESGLDTLHVIAHSMGNRLVANALEELADGGEDQQIVSELVLAAPDIDAEVFQRQFGEVLPRLARRATLYVSDQDFALARAENLPGRPRAGQREGGLLGIAGFDSIDASNLELDFLAHSYYANNVNMLADIYCLLSGAIASQRPLLARISGDLGPAWEIRPNSAFEGGPPDPSTCDASTATPIAPAARVTEEVPSDQPRREFSWLWATLVLLILAIGAYLVMRRRA